MKPRIGRQVKHFEEVNINSIKAIFSDDHIYRYTLQMKYNNRRLNNETMSVILKNPSSANEKMADNTIRRVESYVYKNFKNVKYLNILNIFSYRATDPKDVKLALNKYGLSYIVGPENDKYILELLKESDYIIKAWGRNSGINKKYYDFRINEVNNIINKIINNYNNIPVYRVNGNGRGSPYYPFHACFWGHNMELEKY